MTEFKQWEKFPPTHPGKILVNRFLKPRNLTLEKLAQDVQIPIYQLQDLVRKKVG